MTDLRRADPTSQRNVAVERARRACAALDGMGVTARVFGSLAKGNFGPGSDIDLLVTRYPHRLKYAIEGVVEDYLEGIPFDVVYLDEVPKYKLDRFLKEAVDARDLR